MTASPPRSTALLATCVLIDALLAGALLLAGPHGARVGWWAYGIGLNLVIAAAMLAATAVVAGSVVAMLASRRAQHAPASRAATAAVLAIIPLAIVVPQAYKVFALPFIHDISTDLDAPPVFQAEGILTAARENSLVHGGTALAALQRAGYPDLSPIHSALPVGGAFAHAHDVARRLGWEIIEAEPMPARIEAVAKTRWFGFKDDIAIRIGADGAGSRIDLRSVSRVGASDVGANAARIRAFVEEFARSAGM